MKPRPAPALVTSAWLNSSKPLDIPDFSGKVLVIEAFQMLCPGCVSVGLPQVQRKEELAALLSGMTDERVRYAEHVLGAGEKLFAAMCAEGLEGVVSKKVDAPYRGKRSKAWLKIKCTKRQEFVIVGWSDSSAKGRPLSSMPRYSASFD